MKKFLFLFLFPISYFLFPSLTHAQEVSLVVSPPRIDITANPGETIQKTIKITNDSADRELILQARTFDFIVQDNLGTPIRVTETASGRYLASPWFTLERSELVIPPKSTTQLVAIITIPQDALPGGHYAGVFFEPVTNRGGKNTVSYTTTQVGSLFGITIAGDIKYDALVKSFQTKLNFNEFGPIDFTAELENQSDTHIRPTTKIVIHDMLGRQLTELPLDEVNIFPYTSRLLNGTWNQVWGFGR
ncbi:MAG: hypothetical protein UX82_C0030G0012, partial [Microgenomates group bacterium GW2011_GWE1_47_12]